MDINITLNAPDLSSAIQSLADAIVAAGCIPVQSAILDSAVQSAELIKQIELAPVYQTPIQVYAEPPVQQQAAPIQTQSPVAPPVQAPQQYAPPAAVPTQAPAQQALQQPVPLTTPPAVPTTAQTYTMEQLGVAATQLMESPGHDRKELTALLSQYGVQALTQLPKEQYGNFATQLRAMGARILMNSHALLSASAAHKWLNCTRSARLEETLPDSTSEYAAEGSLAHEIAELKLRKAFVEPMGPRKFNNALKKLQEKPLYQDEMLKCTDTYLDYVSGIVHGFSHPPFVAVEKKLNYSTYAPEGFGTGDCIIIGGSVLHVIDYKHGKGVPVSAVDNPQMKLYALGAFMEYSFLFPITTVKIAIVQPRLENISEFEMPIADLLAWGDSIKPIAQAAFNGEGEYVSGEHCRFCRAKSLCRARSEFNLGLEEFNMMKPPLISNEEVGQILERAQNLAKWAKDLEEYALAQCLAGNVIPGWKAVEGRSNRQFINQDEAFKVLMAAGYNEALLYKREPITLAKVEELVGKAEFNNLLAGQVNKPPGKPTLALETDKKEPIKRRSAEDDFIENGGNENGEQ